MFFPIIVFISAFLIEGIGSYISIIGLSALFASNPVIIAMSLALDFGKVTAVSFLYKYWGKMNFFMRTYMTIAACTLILITSTGAFGFLSGQFQHAIATTGQQTIMISTLQAEQKNLQARKQQIDSQIASLGPNIVYGRMRLIHQYQPEMDKINARLAEIDKELPQLQIQSINQDLHVGPILYVAKAFNTTPEVAVKYVILILVFVFDPFAVALLIAGNFLVEQHKLRMEQKEAKHEQPYYVDRGQPGHPEPDPSALKDLLDKIKPEHVGELIDDAPVGQEAFATSTVDVPKTEPTLVQLPAPIQEPVPIPEPAPSVEPEPEPDPIQEPVPEVVQPAVVEPQPEVEVKKGIRLKIEEQDGRDLISMEKELPATSLDNISVAGVDIMTEPGATARQTNILRNYYTGDSAPEKK